jgi:hypothetical protein
MLSLTRKEAIAAFYRELYEGKKDTKKEYERHGAPPLTSFTRAGKE